MATALTFAQLEGYWIQAGGDPKLAPTMAAIALAESGGDPTALNPIDNHGKQSSFGLWQISNGTHAPPDPHWADPPVNARLAVAKEKSQGLSAWGTYSSGAYLAYLQAFPPAPVIPAASTPTVRFGGSPPKVTLASATAAPPDAGSPAAKTDPMATWNLFCGSVGYWLPHALNKSRAARSGIRGLAR